MPISMVSFLLSLPPFLLLLLPSLQTTLSGTLAPCSLLNRPPCFSVGWGDMTFFYGLFHPFLFEGLPK